MDFPNLQIDRYMLARTVDPRGYKLIKRHSEGDQFSIIHQNHMRIVLRYQCGIILAIRGKRKVARYLKQKQENGKTLEYNQALHALILAGEWEAKMLFYAKRGHV